MARTNDFGEWAQQTFKLWAQFSADKLTDTDYLQGWISAWGTLLVIMAVILFPVILRGGFSPLVGFGSQIAQGFYWVRKGTFPDIIGGAMHILRMGKNGMLEFDLDYIFEQKLLRQIVPNPFQAYLLRRSAVHCCQGSSLMRLNPHGPKRRRWWQKLKRRKNPLSNYRSEKQRVIRRYQQLYKPLLAALGELTNDTAALAMLGVPMERRLLLLAKTFTRPPGQEAYHRLHLFEAETLANWPEDPCEPVSIVKPEYVDRYHLSAQLAKQYRRYPWRFCVMVYFITPEQAAKAVAPLNPLAGPYAGWVPHFLRQLSRPVVLTPGR